MCVPFTEKDLAFALICEALFARDPLKPSEQRYHRRCMCQGKSYAHLNDWQRNPLRSELAEPLSSASAGRQSGVGAQREGHRAAV